MFLNVEQLRELARLARNKASVAADPATAASLRDLANWYDRRVALRELQLSIDASLWHDRP